MTKAAVVAALALFILLILPVCLRKPASPSGPAPVQTVFQSALTNPVDFAKNQFKGGVGVMLRMEPTNGMPVIQGVIAGSPAEKAGLRVGDYIVQVNGQATKGMPLAQIVDKIRGFTLARVALAVQRGDSTNLVEYILDRNSMSSLLGTRTNPPPGTNTR